MFFLHRHCYNMCSNIKLLILRLFLLFSPPEIPPPAPLQTQDGSAVAKTDTTVVFFCFCFVLFSGPVAADCAETFLFMQRRSNSTKQTPDGKSQHQPATSGSKWGAGGGQILQKRATSSSTDTATLVCF